MLMICISTGGLSHENIKAVIEEDMKDGGVETVEGWHPVGITHMSDNALEVGLHVRLIDFLVFTFA